MKKSICIFTISALLILQGLMAQDAPSKKYTARYHDVMARTQWWREARFGMFIHFGAYAVPARGEWVKSVEKLSTEQYQKYVDAFNPAGFDAK